MLRGLANISIFAADHEAAKAWYTELLGLEPYFNRPGYCEFRVGDDQDELGIVDRKYIPYLNFDAGAAGTITYWHVDDVQASLDRLLSLGATELEGVKERGEGFVTASVLDPFGNVLGIMYNPHWVEVLGKREAR